MTDFEKIQNQNIQKIIEQHFQSDMVQASFNLRKCSFDLKSAFKIYINERDCTYDIVLSPEAKAMWFQTWCIEKGVCGVIDCEVNHSSTLANDKFYSICTVKVLVDGNVIAKDVASRIAMLDNLKDLDCGVQIASSYAKGRALSNAGFGVCCSRYGLPFNVNDGLTYAGSASGSTEEPLPFTFAEPANQQTQGVNQSFSAGNNVQNMNNWNSQTPNSASAVPNNPYLISNQNPAVEQGEDAAYQEALNYRITKGFDAGKTLGELLDTKPKQLLSRYATPSCPVQEIRERAMLLAKEARRRCGESV